jgi:hypothetical protein
VLVALAVAVGGCASAGPSRADVAKALVTSGYRPAEARCLADAYAKVLDGDELRDVAERGGGGVPAAKATRLSEALQKCAVPVPSDATTTSSTPLVPEPTTSEPGATPSTSAPTSSSSTSPPDGSSSTSPAGSATAGQ